MKYKNNMQMKAQCQMHGQKEAHCQEQIRQKRLKNTNHK